MFSTQIIFKEHIANPIVENLPVSTANCVENK